MGAKRLLTHTQTRTCARMDTRTHTHRSLPLLVLYLRLYTPTLPRLINSPYASWGNTLFLALLHSRARALTLIQEDPSREAGSERRSAHGTRSLTCRFPASFSCRFSSCSNKPDYRRTARLLQHSRQLQTGRHRVFDSGDCGFYP